MADYKFQEVCTTFYTGIIGSIARKLSDPTFLASLSGKSAQQIGQLIHEAAGIPIAAAHKSRITGNMPPLGAAGIPGGMRTRTRRGSKKVD